MSAINTVYGLICKEFKDGLQGAGAKDNRERLILALDATEGGLPSGNSGSCDDDGQTYSYEDLLVGIEGDFETRDVISVTGSRIPHEGECCDGESRTEVFRLVIDIKVELDNEGEVNVPATLYPLAGMLCHTDGIEASFYPKDSLISTIAAQSLLVEGVRVMIG